MSMHAERAKVYKILDENKIDRKRFVIGAGETYTRKNKRFEFAAQNRTEIREKTAEYAIKYFTAYDFYLVWQIEKISNGRTVKIEKFSVAYDEVMEAARQKRNAKKDVEYAGWGEETVRIFSFEELKLFLAAQRG